MNWKILNVSIPVKNLEKSKDFYNTLLDNNLEDKNFYKKFFEKSDDDIFLGVPVPEESRVGVLNTFVDGETG